MAFAIYFGLNIDIHYIVCVVLIASLCQKAKALNQNKGKN